MSFVPPKPLPPATSWWTAHAQPGVDRRPFYAEVEKYDVERFRMQTRNVGTFQTNGPMRISRPKDYDRGWEGDG